MSAANDLRYGMTSWFIGFCDWYLRTFFATNSEKEKEEIRYTKYICKEILDDTKDIDGIELDFRIDGFYANGMIMGTRKQIVYTDHIIAFLYQSVTQMGTQKTGSSCH